MLVITDVCLCEYTDHGHCGIVIDDEIANDPTVDQLVRAAVSHAAAGADIVAPSDMMDGRVGAIRQALDERGFEHTRDHVLRGEVLFRVLRTVPRRRRRRRRSSATAARTRWIRPTPLEALREVEQDIEEGADIVMVKPALPYLDVIARVKDTFGYPTAAYHVSGEYAMLKAAARNGWIDEPRAMLETLTAIRRAGADIIITYYARDAARALASAIEADGTAHGLHDHLVHRHDRHANIRSASLRARVSRFSPAASTARSAPSSRSARRRCSSSAPPARASRTSTATRSSTT